MFYSKAWQYCNEVLHDKDKYREHVIEWYRRLNKEIERGQKPIMKKYTRKQKIDIEKYDTAYIRLWNILTINMMKNVADEKVNDIRNYFPMRQVNR